MGAFYCDPAVAMIGIKIRSQAYVSPFLAIGKSSNISLVIFSRN
jgi:hypothetical protein